MSDFGHDLDCNDDLDPGMQEASGLYLLRQDIRWRLSTRRGLLIDDADYGIDLRDLVCAELTPAEIAHIPSTIDSELLKDKRIYSTQTEVSWDEQTLTLTVEVEVQSALGPFDLVFEITADKIKEITGNA